MIFDFDIYFKMTWLITFVGVVLLDVDYGLVIGMGISILMIIFKDQYFQMRSMLEYRGKGGFVDEDSLVPHKVMDVTYNKAFYFFK